MNIHENYLANLMGGVDFWENYLAKWMGGVTIIIKK